MGMEMLQLVMEMLQLVMEMLQLVMEMLVQRKEVKKLAVKKLREVKKEALKKEVKKLAVKKLREVMEMKVKEARVQEREKEKEMNLINLQPSSLKQPMKHSRQNLTLME